jgi:predicted glycogen debranching enzyme
MMFNHLRETILTDKGRARLSEQPDPQGMDEPLVTLREFRLEFGLPVWTFEHEDNVIEKRIVMPHRQNTVFVTCERVSGMGRVEVSFDPWVHFRPHEGTLSGLADDQYALRLSRGCYEIEDLLNADLPPLRLKLAGAKAIFEINERRIRNVRYLVEQSRGYDSSGDLYSPGTFRADLEIGVPITIIASTEDWRTIDALSPAQALAAERTRRARLVNKARQDLPTLGSDLVLAADHFIMHPAGRLEDAARAHADGDEERTILAGYHWFTDWGRDTMISLEGLTLVTGRIEEAGYILRTFAKYIRDGLIPNMFPEGQGEGLYHTADATLWFFHAAQRYLDASGDHDTLQRLLPQFEQIIAFHERGTRFGIHVDRADGLLVQGSPGYQLTWMDAKVGDLVVTPRRGKAVEINALWYNALRLMQEWMESDGGDEESAKRYRALADRVRESFNSRFWNERSGALFDVVDGEDGDDDAIRPNQLFAISLPRAVLDPQHWKAVLDVSHDRLLTPYGLRTLAPNHPAYQPQYFGDLRARDLAYHQGTVWPWLIGPYVDAWRRVYPDRIAELRPIVESLGQHLASAACIGSISEIFDAEPPYTPRGCCAQAWSVAEVLRLLWAVGAELHGQMPHSESLAISSLG